MKTKNYSWETEEESDWDTVVEPEPPPRRHARRTLLLLGAAVVLVFAAIFVLFERRLAAREELVRQNVIAAHRTWEQAVARQDLELFSSLVAREDTDWYQSQRRLLMAGRAVDRGTLEMSLQPAELPEPAVELDANWRRALVSYPRAYTFTRDGREQTINLLLTHHYQLRGSRWQAVPPSVSFWGATLEQETHFLHVTYPARDRQFVERLIADLTRDIAALCAEYPTMRDCAPRTRVPILFETDPESLLVLGDPTTPALSGRAFLLPAPSLVGTPLDETSYHALYHGYTDRIIRAWRNNLSLPIPLPEQDIAVLCFPSPDEGLALFSYTPATDTWAQQSDTRRFSTMQPLPNDSGLILRAGFPGTELAHLELFMRRAGAETQLFKEGTTEQSVRLDDIPPRPDSDSLILSSVQGSTGLTSYRLMPLESCDDGACDLIKLSGYPIWSPDGRATLVLTGSDVYLGDPNGAPLTHIGRGFSPFWLTDDLFGYVRLPIGATGQGPQMELVLGSLTTGDQRQLAKSADLLNSLGTQYPGTFRIMYAAANPSRPSQLFLAGTPVAGRDNFYILKLQLEEQGGELSLDSRVSTIEVFQALNDLPVGDASTLTPTGYPPFSITSDGRWLTVIRFDNPVTNTWVFYLIDTQTAETKVLTLSYPAYPAPFPFYDWSADSQWLLLVDNGFLRLVAPAHDYERTITHDYAACRYPSWVNPSVVSLSN